MSRISLETITLILLLSTVGCSTTTLTKPVYYNQNTTNKIVNINNYKHSIGGSFTIRGYIPYQEQIEIKENYKLITAR